LADGITGLIFERRDFPVLEIVALIVGVLPTEGLAHFGLVLFLDAGRAAILIVVLDQLKSLVRLKVGNGLAG
jgi:hypothetical protein